MNSAAYYSGSVGVMTYFGYGNLDNPQTTTASVSTNVFGKDISFERKIVAKVSIFGGSATYNIQKFESGDILGSNFEGYFQVTGNSRVQKFYLKGSGGGTVSMRSEMSMTVSSPTVNISLREAASSASQLSSNNPVEEYKIQLYTDLDNDGFNEYYEGSYNASTSKIDIKSQSGKPLFSVTPFTFN